MQLQKPDTIEAALAQYEPLARKMARHFFHAGQDIEDLRQVARIGIFRAFETFDPDRGQGHFGACVKSKILHELTEYRRLCAFHFKQTSKPIRRIFEQAPRLIRKSGLPAGQAIQQAAQELEVQEHMVIAVLGVLSPMSEFSEQIGERLIAPNTAIATFEASDRWSMLMTAMSRLTREQQEIVIDREIHGLSYEKIGHRIGVSHKTAGDRYKAAMEKLRASMPCKFSDLF